uniref:F-box domain-containing protein n=1 Tax=Mycena chlorophos TaxID=658473 RepID=A0ABQ0LR54_MYCCL|nr:predicted protein [Mycena chlorophos]
MSAISSKLTRLPPELLSLILEHLDRAELALVAPVNRSLHNQCLPGLYRAISLEEPAKLVQCFKTLASNASCASCVRHLSLDELHLGRYPLRATRLLLRSGIQNMTGLQVLGLENMLTESYIQLLDGLTFPRLHTVVLPHHPGAVPFILRHPHLTSISFIPPVSSLYHLEPLSGDTKPSLSQLRFFSGWDISADFVLSGARSVRQITLRCSNGSSSSLAALLQRHSAALSAVQDFTLLTTTFDDALFRALATYIPSVQNLVLYHTQRDPELDAGWQRYAAFEKHLTSFPNLVLLLLTHHGAGRDVLDAPAEAVFDMLNGELQQIVRWGSIAPTLAVCTFPSGHQWIRGTETGGPLPRLWLPHLANEASDERRNAAQIRLQLTILAVAWSPAGAIPAEYLEHWTSVVGKEVFARFQDVVERATIPPDHLKGYLAAKILNLSSST